MLKENISTQQYSALVYSRTRPRAQSKRKQNWNELKA